VCASEEVVKDESGLRRRKEGGEVGERRRKRPRFFGGVRPGAERSERGKEGQSQIDGGGAAAKERRSDEHTRRKEMKQDHTVDVSLAVRARIK